MRDLFYKFFRNVAECFRGYNMAWHFLAVALTYIIVTSGFDWFYYISSRSAFLRPLFFPAVAFGGLLPIVVPLALYIFAAVRKNKTILNTSLALGQAAIIGLAISSFYKALTGRMHPPEFLASAATTDISHEFRFGFLRGGVFWGWPSSHTAVAFAMATALLILYPRKKFLTIPALLYALYVGIGISVTIHWFSEFVAGAVIGTVIGVVVGRSFRERYLSDKNF